MTKRTILMSAVLLAWLFAGSMMSVAYAQMEYDTNRNGSDYQGIELSEPRPELCQAACERDGKCKAWSYVKPGIQGARARCWLKNSVPGPSPSNCCVSGVKAGGGGSDSGSGGDIIGSWQPTGPGCKFVLTFSMEGSEFVGRITDMGTCNSRLFRVGEVFARMRPLGGGKYSGPKIVKASDGSYETWRDVTYVVNGDRLEGGGLTYQRVGNGGGSGTGGGGSGSGGGSRGGSGVGGSGRGGGGGGSWGGCDISGAWTHKTGNAAEAIWTFTPRSDGRYDAIETGLANASGVATVNGRTISLAFRVSGRTGTFVWTLNENCTASVSGIVDGTPTSLWRIGGGGSGSGSGGGAGSGGGRAGGICADQRTLAIMDEWLGRANPPQNQQRGWSVRYEAWGRLVGRSASAYLSVAGSPDTHMTRCEWLWYYSPNLRSTNLGTLKEYVEARR